ncbi:MAG: hypothetical protein CMR00_10845 [[Chlorobium] sp. 445]|nr:MAG: hypothetical protein CMR00_10845 [[Chlorobium] sp. 445]
MFQFSRRDSATLEQSQSRLTDTSATNSLAPQWAKDALRDTSGKIIAHIHIAAACPFCTNYNPTVHMCDLYGEPIPQREELSNPCKGNTFNRKIYNGNRLAQLRALRRT